MGPAPSWPQSWGELFTGPFRHLDGCVSQADDTPALPAVQLLRPEVLGETLARYRRHHGDADRRAVASMWSQWYLALLLPPLILAGMARPRVPPAALQDIDVILDPTGQPAGMRLAGGVDADDVACPFLRYAPLWDGHVQPLAEALRALSGVSERLVWNNAGVQLDWTVRQAAALGRFPASGVADGRRLLQERTRPDGSHNPLYLPVRPLLRAHDCLHIRRLCCLRYQLPAHDHCAGACPLLFPKDAA